MSERTQIKLFEERSVQFGMKKSNSGIFLLLMWLQF